MPTNEKEYNGYLFDQLTLIERIEMALESGDLKTVKKVTDFERKQIERKLYQSPPLNKPE